MNPEIILLTAFGHLSGKLYFVTADKEYKTPAEYQGNKVIITYKDTGETKHINGKPRRIFDLIRIEKNGHGQTTQ